MSTINPVDFLIDRFGMTRLDMTEKYGFGANHLLLAAQGRKDSIGISLRAALDEEATRHGLDVDALIQEQYGVVDLPVAWEQWRRRMRADVDLPIIPKGPPEISPWARIIETFGSVAKTAQTLRVRDLVVSRYATKPTMPGALREALEDTGWTGVEALDRQQRAYFHV